MTSALGATALVASLSAAGSGAQAQQPDDRRWALQWSRGPSATACVGAAELTERVVERLGRNPFGDPAGAELTIEGQVNARDAGYEVSVQVAERDGSTRGVRRFEEPTTDCRDLDEAIVLVVAMTVDPSAAMSPPAETETPSEPSPAEAEAVEPATVPVSPAPAHSIAPPDASVAIPTREPSGAEPVALRAELLGAARLGITPSIVAGPALRIALRVPPLPAVAIDAAWYPSVDHRVGEGSTRFDHVSAGIAVCPRMELAPRLDLEACAKVELDHLAATARGYAQNLDAASTFAAAGPALALTWRAGDTLLVGVHAEAMLPLERDRFVVESADGADRIPLHRPAPVAARLALSLGVR